MTNQDIQQRAVERQRRRMVELERRIQIEGAACPPGLLEERDELRLVVAALEAGLPAPVVVPPPQPASVEAQRVVWPADGKDMVLVPAGPFVFGVEQSHRRDNQPAHEVDLPAYYIDRTPVTIAEYGRFIAATGHPKPKIMFPNGWPHDYERHPVTGVSWHDARAYAAWAGKRLPSEAEWEKAASWDWTSATKRRYPWGDEWDARRCNMAHSGPGHTTPVGAFSPYGDSPCGAADMAGNVAEWTSGLAWNYPYKPGDGRDDPERYGVRVRRGGSYVSEELFLRTTTRCASPTDGLFFTEGFRCVADPSTETRRPADKELG
jgi:formylglycine-generating enzyme required for sulfatase activity